MNGNRMKIAAVAAAGLMLVGCEGLKFTTEKPKPVRPASPTLAGAITPVDYFAKTSVKTGFQRDDGAVNDAIVWMERYTKEQEKAGRLEKEKQALKQEKERLSGKLAKLAGDMNQAEREINDANDAMLRLKKNLELWKGNVLGYRDEARQRHGQVMGRLAGIEKLLGAEVGPEPATTALFSGAATGGPAPGKPTVKAKETQNVAAGS